ncbi:taurine ABC transporter substrate-binding protein [Desulfosarcina alkanivorans]|uniref:Taurine ABC transporter substrate-binding protein n=1 Tax=Desulfosarcina alkanivorans TaxID=571177 RepID=A0A5K7YF58_9BACT|nr:aliphatic sulfonate ABC transporter substrate-binding protein [Desulfosarcina alkanivorans]BBO68142.1 taurine ABC transporter substrate-binding protein [Desulfosarcina alkanivorans]
MTGFFRKSLILAAALILAISVVAVHAEGKPEKVTVIYGGSSWLGHYPAWVGIEKGLFKNHGLGVLFQNFYASSGRMGSLVAGDLDVASTGSISAIALMASGSRGFMAFGTQDSYATVEGIIAKESIKTIKDLRGKRIAAPFASSAHVLVLDILEQNGLDPEKDLTLLNLKVNEMPAAMGSGEIDACAAWTPHFNKLLNMPGNHMLVNDTEFSLYKEFKLGPGPDLLVVRKEFAEKYPNTCKAFVKGYFEAVDMLINQPEECAKVLVKLTNLSMEDQMTVLKDITWIKGNEQKALMVDPGGFTTGMQQLAEFLVKHQQIDEAPKVKTWIAESMVP